MEVPHKKIIYQECPSKTKRQRKNQTFPQKLVLPVACLFSGVKNGRTAGVKLNIAAMPAEVSTCSELNITYF